MEQKTIPEPKEPTKEDLEELEKLGKADDLFFQRLNEQMKSPEGLEGIKLPQGEEKNQPNLSEIMRKQEFLKEFWKWERAYTVGSMGIVGDLPSHIDNDQDVKFINKNKFEIPLEFADFLISNALDGASGEILEKLKDMLKKLNEIVFADILESKDLLLLTLKSKNEKIALAFEVKYPFKFKAGRRF